MTNPLGRIGAALSSQVERVIPAEVFHTLKIRALGAFQIPLLLFVAPSVVALEDSRCEVKIPLGWRTKNHLGGMYFGVLAAGADLAGGIIAWHVIEKTDPSIKLIFKDFHADFLKRS